jgi:nitrous oxidase accessory protein NosD
MLTGNAFIGNQEQVKYVGTRFMEWSFEGRGNFWSDHPAFDLNGDGIADGVYRPNDLMDHILWSQPRLPAHRLSRRAAGALVAVLVPGNPAGRRDRQPSADAADHHSRSRRHRRHGG